MSELADKLISLIEGGDPQSQPSTPANFAQEMRSKGIHLGMGRNPVCVTCGETWPCSTEQEARRG